MRAQMGRIGFVAVLAASTAQAQFRDTLQVGDRVRVRVAATRGATNLFVGNLSSVSADTLVIDIPGGKGSIVLPRSAVAEVALSQGNISGKRAAAMLPFISPALGIAYAASNPPPGPLRASQRKAGLLLSVAVALPGLHLWSRQPIERWEPAYHWLEHR